MKRDKGFSLKITHLVYHHEEEEEEVIASWYFCLINILSFTKAKVKGKKFNWREITKRWIRWWWWWGRASVAVSLNFEKIDWSKHIFRAGFNGSGKFLGADTLQHPLTQLVIVTWVGTSPFAMSVSPLLHYTSVRYNLRNKLIWKKKANLWGDSWFVFTLEKRC